MNDFNFSGLDLNWYIDKEKDCWSDFMFSILSINGYCLLKIELTHFFEHKESKQKDEWDCKFDFLYIMWLIDKITKKKFMDKII